MYRYFSLILILPFLIGCAQEDPRIEDYLGAYRIIKAEVGEESISPLPLNQVEITEEAYYYRIDNNGDNRFSPEECLKMDYSFFANEGGGPYLQVEGNPERIYLLRDKYYDVLFRQGEKGGPVLYGKSYRHSMKPGPKDFSGSYRVIKFRENGTILNVAHTGRITITENRYMSELDLDRDGVFSDEERVSAAYTRHEADDGFVYLKMNDREQKVWVLREETFDLLLLLIDEWGNETIIYLKR